MGLIMSTIKKQNLSTSELLTPEINQLLLEHGFNLDITLNESRKEPFYDSDVEWLDSYKSFNKDEKGLSFSYPVYKALVDNLPVYSLTPIPDVSDSGFCGFLSIDSDSTEKSELIIQQQNDFVRYKSYNLILNAKGFKGGHKHNCLDKEDILDLTALELIKNCMDEIKSNSRVLSLGVSVEPVDSNEALTTYNSTLSKLREHCGSDMIVFEGKYNHKSGALILKIPVESLEPINFLERGYLIHDFKVLSEELGLNNNNKNIKDVAIGVTPTDCWTSDMLILFFLITTKAIPDLNLESVMVSENQHLPKTLLLKDSGSSNVDAYSMIKNKTEKRLMEHGLSLDIDPDTSDGESDEYVVSVSLHNDWFDGEVRGCKNTSGGMDKVVNDTIDDIVKAIDSDKDTVTLIFHVNTKKTKISKLITAMQEVVYNEYGLSLAIGTYSLNSKKGELQVNLSLKSLPSFLKFLDLSDKNIYMDVKNNIVNLNKGGVFREVDITNKLDILIANKPYAEWDEMMMHAFIDVLLGKVGGIEYNRALGIKISSQ